jgi:hypothetical protein
MRPNRWLFALTALAVVALAAPAVAHHVNEGNVRFKVTCQYSHSLSDDPIVFPNQPGVSHRHDFWGNDGVNANTTTWAMLRNFASTCNDTQDEAAYWLPTVYANGVEIVPEMMTAYYRLGEKHPPIDPWERGLKVIAGDVPTEAGVQNASHFGWKCEGDVDNGLGDPLPASCGNDTFIATVEFPDCWDGVNLDSADHRSHLAYSTDPPPAGPANVCPATHPVQIPEITVFAHYHAAARPVTLSSGDVDTLHSDFFDGWGVTRLQERIDTCLNGLQRCGSGG